MSIAAGTRLGRYEISSQLGAGGMGEVYLAQDTRLGRRAALKILPAKFTESEDRLRRFEREASAASALNHPNIITIHEIGHEDSLHFMAMEFVDGETLRVRMNRDSLSLREALDVAVQVADALAAAHEAGIVHRDIKPENIMIRRDGYVKVLDFGLAKLTERQAAMVDSQAPTIAKTDTDPGVVMGTMQYMSPEQARGLEIDKRTDIWSLGVVLYEMVARRAPFEGETPSDVIVSLLAQEPPPLSQQAEEVPYELERIVRKALQKNREERYQTIKDMALDLKSLRRELEVEAELDRTAAPGLSGSMRVARSGGYAATTIKNSNVSTGGWPHARTTTGGSFISRIGNSKRNIALGLVALLGVGGLAFMLYKLFGQGRNKPASAGLFRQPQVIKLTTNGNTRVAALSPDGKYVVYAIDEGGKQSLWLRQVAISSNVRLLPLAAVTYFACGFSADGNFIYYAMGDEKNPPAIYKLPILGGSPTKIIGDLTGPIALSPDGKQIAIVNIDREKEEVTLSVANIDRTGERKLMSRKFPEGFDWVGWSPDGKSIACPVGGFGDHNNPQINIVEVQVADGAQKVISSQRWINSGEIAWLSDKSGMLVNARSQASSFDQIWHISYPDGESRSIINDLNDYRGVSISADSTAFVSVQFQKLSNVWLSKSAKDHNATQITPGVGTYYDLAHTTDGHILYSSDASGSADIWEAETDGTNRRQLTAGAGRNYSPSASPDGRYIVFHSDRSGAWQIWRMDRDGSNPKQLTFDTAEGNWPEVSPDSQWIIYQRMNADYRMTLWRVGIDGGTPVQLNDVISLRPTISPDGKSIACWQYKDPSRPGLQIAIMPATGGKPIKVFDLTPNAVASWDAALKWTPDGRALTYVDERAGVGNVWSQPLAGGKPSQLTNFNEHQIFSFDLLRDGRLVCSRGFRASDAVLIKDAR